VRVAASAETTFSAACQMNLQRSMLIRAIFKIRELILGGKPEEVTRSTGLVARAKAWGWGILAEDAGREIIFGAATQPWLANLCVSGAASGRVRGLRGAGVCKDCLDVTR
jgi:hypothetical protein